MNDVLGVDWQDLVTNWIWGKIRRKSPRWTCESDAGKMKKEECMNRIMEEVGHFKDFGIMRISTSSFNHYYLFACLTNVYGAAMCQAPVGTRDLTQSDWGYGLVRERYTQTVTHRRAQNDKPWQGWTTVISKPSCTWDSPDTSFLPPQSLWLKWSGVAWASEISEAFQVTLMWRQVWELLFQSRGSGPEAKSSPLPAFVNKVLLGHCPTHSLMYCHSHSHYARTE